MMASGQQLTQETARQFAMWAASKTGEDFRGIVSRGVLSRTNIAAEYGFALEESDQANPSLTAACRPLQLQSTWPSTLCRPYLAIALWLRNF